jgi:hypothetical protein
MTAMPRHTKAHDPAKAGTRPPKAIVEVRRYDDSKGWSVQEARGLVQSGYRPDHVAQLTGVEVVLLVSAWREPRWLR